MHLLRLVMKQNIKAKYDISGHQSIYQRQRPN